MLWQCIYSAEVTSSVKGASNPPLIASRAVQGSSSQHCQVSTVQAAGSTACESDFVPLPVPDLADTTGVLRSAGCSTLRQWDLTRAVPRLVRDVKLEKGDIMGIATRKGFVYTCGADGSMRWAACPPPCLPGCCGWQACLISALVFVDPSQGRATPCCSSAGAAKSSV